MSVFKAYDIRGSYPSEIDGSLAYKVARAYAYFFSPKTVAVGHDLRASSKELYNQFIKGLKDSGIKVTAIGHCTTPMLYYAGFSHEGSAMITASHLDGRFNGIKLNLADAIPLSGPTGIYKIGKSIEMDFPIKSGGIIKRKSVLSKYHSFISRFAKKTSLKVLVDCGNGMGFLDTKLLKKFAKVSTLYETPNFSFPNHIANPANVSARKKIKQKMRSGKYDLGMILDGDCDRAGFLDEKGNFIPMDHVTGILAQHLAKKGDVVIVDPVSSRAVSDAIKEIGARPMLCKAGHSFISIKARKQDAVLAGEMSGHYFFREFHYSDNAILTAIVMLKILDEKKVPLSVLAKPFRKYIQMGGKAYKVNDKEGLLNKIEEKFASKAVKISKLDGVTVVLKDGWFNVRKSNTEPVVRLTAEADNREALKNIRVGVESLIRGNL